MSAIFKGVKSVTNGLLGGLTGILGGKPPGAPGLLAGPDYNDNMMASSAAHQQRKKQMSAQGRRSTLLSVDSSQTNPGLNAPIKSLLGG